MATKTFLVCAAALTLVVAALNPAFAARVEVPVAGLNGYYFGGDDGVTGTFSISFDPGDIQSARIEIIGNLVWPSYMTCGGVNGFNFLANMSTTSGEWFTDIVYVDQRVSFITYLDWQASGNATWEFLSSGNGAFVLTGFPRPLPEGCGYLHGSSDTTAEVIDVKIVFEIRDPVRVEQSTWGRIKSLYHTD